MTSPAEALHQRIIDDSDVDLSSLQTGTDKELSIGRDVWRLRWRGQPTAAVASNADLLTTCGALLDALAVREQAAAGSPPAWLGAPLDLSTVNVLVDRPLPGGEGGEVDQALRSMRDAVVGIAARIWYADDVRGWNEDNAPSPVWDLGHPRVRSWVETLLLPRLQSTPPPLAHDLITAVDDPSVQLYPSTTVDGAVDVWSLRADGLQIGTIGATAAALTVGKPGKHGDGPQRKVFIEVFGVSAVTITAAQPEPPNSSVEAAAAGIRSLLRRFRGADVRGAPLAHRLSGGVPYVDEHTLEARLLKGLARLVDVDAGPVLGDTEVARGSQFPTLWAAHGSKARYLDALLAQGSTPHAIELKVATGGQGRYYRRSLVQAVLYRHFLLNAADLDAWFAAAELDRSQTVGAIGVPIPTRWTASFNQDLHLLRAVADRVACTVHVLDDRVTPRRESAAPAGHRPQPDLERHTWQLAAALTARWPRSLGRVAASVEIDGFYDFVVLQALSDRSTSWPAPRPRLKINRVGSVRIYAQTGHERWYWGNLWHHLHGGGELDQAVNDIGAGAGLGIAEALPTASFPQLALEVLNSATTALAWRCAWDPAYGPAGWLDSFPSIFGRYSRTAPDGRIPTVARLWAAVDPEGAPRVIIDHENLRTWVDAGGRQEIRHEDPVKRAQLAAATVA